MPRRGRSSMPSRSPMHQPSRPMHTAPAPAYRAPPPAPMAPAAAARPQGPGLMGQMAATAGGVAIGSVVGHGVSNALFGGPGSSGQEAAPPAQAPPAQYAQDGQERFNPCKRELQQFLDCAQGQSDIGLCAGFNEALRQCKLNYEPRP